MVQERMESGKKNAIKNAADIVTAYFTDVLGKPLRGYFAGQVFGVTAVESHQKGWRVIIEVIEDPGSGIDPILGMYEVFLDKQLNMLSYVRKSIRRSTDTSQEKATVLPEQVQA